MTTYHIEDVRGRSMADAAVGPCNCDPHIEHCPSCAPYLHQPLKPAGEEDKATYKQIADNYTQPADCPRCAELEKAVAFNDETARHYLAGRTEALQKLAASEAENSKLKEAWDEPAKLVATNTRLANDLLEQCRRNVAHMVTITQLTERINDVAIPALLQAARLIKNPVSDNELIEKAVAQIDAIIAKLKGEASEQRNT